MAIQHIYGESDIRTEAINSIRSKIQELTGENPEVIYVVSENTKTVIHMYTLRDCGRPMKANEICAKSSNWEGGKCCFWQVYGTGFIPTWCKCPDYSLVPPGNQYGCLDIPRASIIYGFVDDDDDSSHV